MGFKLDQQQSHIESINKFKEQMKDTLDEALVKSKDEMAKDYDWKRTLEIEYIKSM